MEKRKSAETKDDSDSDDDFGPAPDIGYNPELVNLNSSSSKPLKKKVRHLEFENVYIENLPSANSYEYSLMHRFVSRNYDFIISQINFAIFKY